MQTDPTFHFEHLGQAILAAARAAFAEISERHPTDPVRAFALYTDSGAMTVCPSMAPASYFARIPQDEPDDVDYYRFSPAEWPLECEGAASAFDAICSQLRGQLEQLPDGGFGAFKARLIETCVQSLEVLRREMHGETGDEFLWLVTVSDEDEPAPARNARVRRLNAPGVAHAFEAWSSTWDGA